MQQASSQQYGHQQVPLGRSYEGLEIAPLEPGSFGSSGMQQHGGLASTHNLGAAAAAAAHALSARGGAAGHSDVAARFSQGPLALAALHGGSAGQGWASSLGEVSWFPCSCHAAESCGRLLSCVEFACFGVLLDEHSYTTRLAIGCCGSSQLRGQQHR